MIWLPFFSARLCVCWRASWAFWVNLSRRNIFRFPNETTGQAIRLPLFKFQILPSHLYRCDVWKFDALLGYLNFDLPRLGGFFLHKRHGQEAVFVLRIDLLGVERVRDSEAP